ncbi:hypothetical protein NW845_10780 [Synechococcus sp. H60.2]|uniref:hypothetical protein n=1 Tax=Synechococcus sp. H60.2 TaxID=2964518 RepID=UPI0039C1910C
MEIRPATPEDVPVLFDLICALAEYEHLSHLVTGSAELLHAAQVACQPGSDIHHLPFPVSPEALLVALTTTDLTSSSPVLPRL